MDGIGQALTTETPPTWVARERFDVTEHHRLGIVGMLMEDDPCELIDGEIISVAAISGPHIGAVMARTEIFSVAAPGRFRVSLQNPRRLDTWSEPQPDLELLRPRPDRYSGSRPPTAEDAGLVIEIADSSLRYDTEIKVPLYARAGIARTGDVIAPLALPDGGIAVADVVPA